MENRDSSLISTVSSSSSSSVWTAGNSTAVPNQTNWFHPVDCNPVCRREEEKERRREEEKRESVRPCITTQNTCSTANTHTRPKVASRHTVSERQWTYTECLDRFSCTALVFDDVSHDGILLQRPPKFEVDQCSCTVSHHVLDGTPR